MINNIAVLMGGLSNEAQVSMKTGERVLSSLKQMGYNATPVKVDKNFLEWSIKNKENIDLYFNALHGSWGEDGRIQGVLEYLGKPYTHSGVLSSAISMNKVLSRQLFKLHNIPVAKGFVVEKRLLKDYDPLKRPYVIKPISEGSSLGINLITSKVEINDNLLSSYVDDEVLVEDFIPGRELTVAIKESVPLGMLEIITKNNFYDYDTKYTNGIASYVKPKDIPDPITRYILKTSSKAHKALNCRGITRVDIRFNQKKGKKGVCLLEINTQPGLTESSLVPIIASQAGLGFNEMIKWILEDANKIK